MQALNEGYCTDIHLVHSFGGAVWPGVYSLLRCPRKLIAAQQWLIQLAASAASDGLIPQGGLLYSKLIMESISVWGPLVYAVCICCYTVVCSGIDSWGTKNFNKCCCRQNFSVEDAEFFAKGSGSGNEPLRGYVLSFVVGLGCCLVGQLDVIAPIISNFFMISYAATNYACFAASMSESPGWRKRFKYYNKWLSLFGAILCVVTMFLMDWANSLVSGCWNLHFHLLTELQRIGAPGSRRT